MGRSLGTGPATHISSIYKFYYCVLISAMKSI